MHYHSPFQLLVQSIILVDCLVFAYRFTFYNEIRVQSFRFILWFSTIKIILSVDISYPRYSWESYWPQGDQPVHPKGNQSWVFIGRTDVEAETPILWPPDVKNWLIWKDPDAGKDLGQEENGMTENEMARWHHWLNAHEFGWTPGVGDGQGGLACCGSWDSKESDMTERLNWPE